MFLRNFLPKTLILYIFSSGAPCFVSCSFVFALLRPFCLSGAPFLIQAIFFPKPGAPHVFTQFSAKNTVFYMFSSGAPCFVSCSFVFALLSFFCLSGAPFLILLRPFCLSGAPFLIYTFFSCHALSPKVGGPNVLAQFSAQSTRFLTFFHRGPLVLFLVLLFLLF